MQFLCIRIGKLLLIGRQRLGLVELILQYLWINFLLIHGQGNLGLGWNKGRSIGHHLPRKRDKNNNRIGFTKMKSEGVAIRIIDWFKINL